jgi:hypothetical protein
MWQDPIVEETRKMRDQYASQFNYDMDAIYQDIQRRQVKSNKKLVSLPAQKPSKVLNSAEQLFPLLG